jgi:hypothetical protein
MLLSVYLLQDMTHIIQHHTTSFIHYNKIMLPLQRENYI